MMRNAIISMLGALLAAPVHADVPTSLERRVAEALRDVHDRGADLYNAGDATACYRMYQGGLLVAKAALGHRPEIQKLITDGMAAADQPASISRRAFMLHELIEQVRQELRSPVKPVVEALTVPPRVVKPEPRPAAGVGEQTTGVLGRVLWRGEPLVGVAVTYVSLGCPLPRVFETVTGAQGVYVFTELPAGRYIVLITPGPGTPADVKLPDRYALTTTSPIILDVKGVGEKNDFFLQ